MEPQRRKRKVYRSRVNPLEFFDDFDFLSRYRLGKEVVVDLAARFADSPILTTGGDGRGSVIPAPERFCAALRYLATGASYKTISEYQGISKASLSRAVDEVVTFLCSITHQHIVWPYERTALRDKARQFYAQTRKPCTVGCIGGTHIGIMRPSMQDEGSYINKHLYHSLNVMVVCDAQDRILAVEERFPGSVQDSYVLMASAVEDFALEGHMEGLWFLADAGYSIKPWLMTPYANPESTPERAYNRWHQATLGSVERTISLLKQRWRCLDASAGYLVHSPLKCTRIVRACCVLHNIAMDNAHPLRIDHDRDGEVPLNRRRIGEAILERVSRNGGRDQEEGMDMDADDEDNETANDTVGGEEVRALFVDKAFRHNVLGIME